MVAPGIVLIRHAQSTWNAEGRFQGQADPPLSELGRSQAARAAVTIADRFGDVAVQLISSDLIRAAETADAIAAALGVEAVREPDLREVNGGAWQGLMQPAMAAGWPDEYRRWLAGEDIAWGGAERHTEAGRRVAHAVRRWARMAGDQGRVLIAVGHGASLRAGVTQLVGWAEGYAALGPLGNVSSVEVTPPVDGGPVRLLQWNAPLIRAGSRPMVLPDHESSPAALHLATPGL